MKKTFKPNMTPKGFYQKPALYHLLLLLLLLVFTTDRASGQAKLWGLTASGGGASYYGVIFEYDLAGAGTYTVRHDFVGANGGNPQGSLLESGGKFWGTTNTGGSSNAGVIFEFDPAGAGNYTVKHNFVLGDYPNWGSGSNPYGGLIESGGKFYGMTNGGGSSARARVIFEYDPACGGTYTVKHIFNGPNGGHPVGSLLESGGKLYGMTSSGAGVIFEYDPAGATYTVKHYFHPTNGELPTGSLIESGGKFYGTTAYGGYWNRGMLFEYDPAGAGTYTVKHDFNDDGGVNGANPQGDLLESGGKFYGMTAYGGSSGYNGGVIFEYDPAGAGTYMVKHEFDVTNGRYPTGSLLESDGKFYGTTFLGGSSDAGVVFEYNPAGAGTYTVLKHLGGADGANPFGGHLIAAEGCTPSTEICNCLDDDCDGLIDEGFANTDGDLQADCLDPCPNDPYNDADGDGLCGDVDPCPYNPYNDSDGDDLCADVDPCPYDPYNDLDGDGLCANVDPCPYDPDNDADGDETCGDVDNCPFIFNWDQADADSDGLGDACDACPNDPNNDADGDGICGGCPGDDSDCDGIPDDCDSEPFVDNYTFTGFENLPASWICGNNNDEVFVCHVPPGNPANANTICISPNAVQAHLDHGDYLGECTCTSQYLILPGGNVSFAEMAEQEIEMFPNPASKEVTFHLHGFGDETSELTVFDYSGKAVWQKTMEEGQYELTLNLSGSGFASGVYFVKVSSATNVLTKRLVVSK
ncbi:MAG: T9SS type A sorting domain-containing protein [Saprospiraceae bacterium]|nr:T9SS type A sorting domain-containing protein [Saprospiraceae bacterium]